MLHKPESRPSSKPSNRDRSMRTGLAPLLFALCPTDVDIRLKRQGV